jgi:hypothetical protein
MREHPDHHDAELLLRLYELRREEKLRKAREWFANEYHAESLEDSQARYPRGSEGNIYYRMVMGYWDMAASIVNHGLIKEEFFFDNTSEFWVVWQKVKHLAPAVRRAYQNPFLWKNLETVSEKFEKWMEGRAPEALAALAKIVLEPPARK